MQLTCVVCFPVCIIPNGRAAGEEDRESGSVGESQRSRERDRQRRIDCRDTSTQTHKLKGTETRITYTERRRRRDTDTEMQTRRDTDRDRVDRVFWSTLPEPSTFDREPSAVGSIPTKDAIAFSHRKTWVG